VSVALSPARPENEVKRKYRAYGYVVVDDFLPIPVANRLNEIYASEREWEQQDQVRETHYQHVFKTNAVCLPREDEHYIAKFGRSKKIEQSEEFTRIYDNTVRPTIASMIGVLLTQSDVRCYRLLPGDLYRTHIDDYAGNVGLVYYINKRWVWDWGGILHICRDGEGADQSLTSILPKFNRAVLIDHEKFRFPHFISSVEAFAREPRYTIVSFNR
jgi:Rps23 Pro-64 3,4-dihydroxylase Tpa1-like proline 4-hydroxylase